MSNLHPARELLTRYVRSELTYPQKQRIGKHVSTCLFCRRRAHKLSIEADSALVDYDSAVQRAAEGTFKWLESVGQEDPNAIHLLQELMEGSPATERMERIRSEPRFQALKICQLLQKQCRLERLTEPRFESVPADQCTADLEESFMDVCAAFIPDLQAFVAIQP